MISEQTDRHGRTDGITSRQLAVSMFRFWQRKSDMGTQREQFWVSELSRVIERGIMTISIVDQCCRRRKPCVQVQRQLDPPQSYTISVCL